MYVTSVKLKIVTDGNLVDKIKQPAISNVCVQTKETSPLVTITSDHKASSNLTLHLPHTKPTKSGCSQTIFLSCLAQDRQKSTEIQQKVGTRVL